MMAHAGALATIAAQGLSVLALWLRLRWRVREKQARCRYVVVVVDNIPPGGKIQKRRTDGIWLLVTVAGIDVCEEEDG
jgi:uncharacterized membrane protein